MSEAGVPTDPIQAAWALLQQGRSLDEVEAVVGPISAGELNFAQAQHIRAVCALRRGSPLTAKTLLFDAINRGELTTTTWTHLALVAVALNMPADIMAGFSKVFSRLSVQNLLPFLVQILKTLGFWTKTWTPQKDVIFERILLPLLAVLLERRDMDAALEIELMIYEFYVKPKEEETHFSKIMERVSELFTQSGHGWRAHLGEIHQGDFSKKHKVGFFIHNASMLAHIEVMLNTLKGYVALEDQPFEPIVYCFSGKSQAMEEALSSMGVRLVMLQSRFPESASSKWGLLLRLRELLAEEGVQQLVWVSLVVMLPLAFGMRMAPVQTWWAMKYRNFSQEDIDGYVTGSALTRFATLNDRRWRMGLLGVDDWYDATLSEQAAALRAPFKDRVILMSLGRTEKMRDPAYLGAVVSVLQAHPQTVFLWAGREESPAVVEAFRVGGVLERTHFIGWVNTRLYAQVADIFLDTFPFPCGFTLYQAMAAATPVVIYTSPEAAQTGLWNFLKPVLEGREGDADEASELRGFVGEPTRPLISIARTPEEYVGHAGRLIRDVDARRAAGDASRRFMARYFSDPRAMGRSFARHFVEIMEEVRDRPVAGRLGVEHHLD